MPNQRPIGGLAALRSRATLAFERGFGVQPTLVVAAPGRVNLIGEHTDYNEGFVLPAAIDRHAVLAVRPRPDRTVRVLAADFGEQTQFPLDEPSHAGDRRWGNYQRGVAWSLQQSGFALTGMDAALTSDVPIGSGLSSSAAVELATCYAFQQIGGLDLDGVQRALLCQKAENEFVGMRCGIMDQFVISLGRRGHALLIDCRSLEYTLVPIPEGCSLIVCDTNRRRGLVDSEYNARRSECETGARALGVRALRDLTPQDLEARANMLDDRVRKRCRHVVSEDQRVLDAVHALQVGDLPHFGALMNASHVSLRDDYAVSCRELDAMVEAAWRHPGVLGARMTGAGFGGCTINLVDEEAAKDFCARVSREYSQATGLVATVHVCSAEDGVRVLE